MGEGGNPVGGPGGGGRGEEGKRGGRKGYLRGRRRR